MIRLNQTASQLISLITAQNGATCVVSYSDKSATGYDGDTQVTAITSATTTTICSTPAASTIRDVDHISIKNTFAGSHTVTVQLSSSSVLYPLVTVALANGDSLEYTHGSGWQVLDANGNKKVTPFSGMTSAQLASLISDETGSGALVFANSPTLTTPTISGLLTTAGQVSFPATQNPSADPNTLDDYEEGTFTPVIIGTTDAGTGTYVTQLGKYTKIGNVYFGKCTLNWTAHTGTGNGRIGGLPFTSSNDSLGGGAIVGYVNNYALTASNTMLLAPIQNTNLIGIYQTPVGGGAASTVTLDTAAELQTSFMITV